jgi:hypothetical protein
MGFWTDDSSSVTSLVHVVCIFEDSSPREGIIELSRELCDQDLSLIFYDLLSYSINDRCIGTLW